jgi:hypothetical protein
MLRWLVTTIPIIAFSVSIAQSVSAAVSEVLPDRIRLQYQAPEHCPLRDELVARVSQRVTIAWIADETELARNLRVHVSQTASGYIAELRFNDEDGREVTRSVESDTCDQAVSGIALITALAVDSRLVSVGTKPLEQQPSEGIPSPAPSQPPPPKHSAARLVESPQPAPVVVSRAQHAKIAHEVGVAFGAAAGLAPGVALGASVMYGVGNGPLPWLRAALSWYDFQETAADLSQPTAHFTLFAVEPSICYPFVLAERLTLGIAPCTGVEAGIYRVKGVAPAEPNVTTTVHNYNDLLWAAVMVSTPLRWIHRSVFFEIIPELRFPLVHGSFEFRNPQKRVHEIPSAALGLKLAFGLAF